MNNEAFLIFSVAFTLLLFLCFLLQQEEKHLYSPRMVSFKGQREISESFFENPLCPSGFQEINGYCDCLAWPFDQNQTKQKNCMDIKLSSCQLEVSHSQKTLEIQCNEMVFARQSEIWDMPDFFGPCRCINHCFDHLSLFYDVGFMSQSERCLDVESPLHLPQKAVVKRFDRKKYNSTSEMQNATEIDLLDFQDCKSFKECNYNGICTNETGYPACHCFSSWGGSRCDIPQNTKFYSDRENTCLNQCSGHGVCQGGFCLCDEGFGDLDCGFDARTKTRLVTRDVPKSKTDARFFIYRLALPLSIPWRVNHSKGVWVDFSRATPFYFLEQALSSPLRTLDPEKAEYFLIPIGGPEILDRRPAVDYIIRSFPFWNKTGGSDHFWLPMVNDVGAAEYWGFRLHKIPEYVSKSIFLLNMGLQKGISLPVNGIRGTFVAGKDLVIPPFPKKPWRDVEQPLINTKRTTTLFFSGTIEKGWRVEDGNSRLAVWEAHRNHPGFKIVDGYVKDDFSEMTHSYFCLAPPGKGGGWGIRLSMAVLTGCIPVIVQNNRSLEFEEVLSYQDFSVHLDESQVQEIPEILARITPEKRKEMQKALACVFELFIWKRSTQVVEAVIETFERRKRGSRFTWC